MKKLFTSESVTDGHPDKICDLIADTILDEILSKDRNAKVAVEASIKDDMIIIFGETSYQDDDIEYSKIAKAVLRNIGYLENYQTFIMVGNQSAEINHAVANDGVSAGDQGIMYGYATDETNAYMPMPIYYAHKLTYALKELREKDLRIRPDGKSQVTVEYEDDVPKRIDTIVISTMHTPEITQEEIKKLVMKEVIQKVIPDQLMDKNTKIFINPSGSFVIGGSFGDSGTTGRKIVCDSYGGIGRVGGGCFSSKDPTKVDRSGAYYCRYVAKNIVAHGYAKKCEVQVAYAIGLNQPLALNIDTFGTEKISVEEIYDYVKENFDFSVKNIIEELELRKPIYSRATNFGHFGRDGFSWEKVN